MTEKQIAQEVVQRLPEDVSLHEVARRIDFIAGIREAEFERGGDSSTQEIAETSTLLNPPLGEGETIFTRFQQFHDKMAAMGSKNAAALQRSDDAETNEGDNRDITNGS